MEQTPLQEQSHTRNSPAASESPSVKQSSALRNIVTISAAILGASFFMPWAIFFGGNISGLAIQEHFESYKLVWLLPVCAVVTLVLNMAGVPTGLVRRIVGLIPFAILAYSLNKFGSNLFQILSWGGWLALAAGIVLIITPSAAKPQPKA